MQFDEIIAERANKTIYRDGEHAVKVFRGDHSKADVLCEALNQAHVEETSLNVPRLEAVAKVDGEWAIISQYIAGRTLASLMMESPDSYDEYLDRFVELQMTVHHQTCPMLVKLKDRMNRKIAQSGLDATTRYELHTRLDGMPTHNKLCHGDFDPKNIIIREDGAAYILGWEYASQGNASADAARTYLLFWLAGDVDGAEKYLKLFCKKSDTARQYVQRWIPLVAASQSAMGKPEEREFLLHWVNVADCE